MTSTPPAHAAVIRDPLALSEAMRKSLTAFTTSKNGLRSLTIRQPWIGALLDPASGKVIENRKMRIRPGWICLHAGLKGDKITSQTPVVLKKMWPGIEHASTHGTRGAILAIAHIAAAESASDAPLDLWRDIDDSNVCYRFDVILPLATPVACTGQLGLWYAKGKSAFQVVEQMPLLEE